MTKDYCPNTGPVVEQKNEMTKRQAGTKTGVGEKLAENDTKRVLCRIYNFDLSKKDESINPSHDPYCHRPALIHC